jgi:WD40 repeat protein
MPEETTTPAAGESPPFTPPKEVTSLDTDGQFCVIRHSPCGKYLFAGTFDGRVRRWSIVDTEWQELPPLVGHHGWVQGLQFVTGGTWLLVADSWGQLSCWPYAEMDPQPRWSHPQAHDGWIRGLNQSRDGSLVATAARDGAVRVWRTDSGELVRAFEGHGCEVFGVAIHPNNNDVASGDLLGKVRHWNVHTGECLRSFSAGKMHLYQRIQDVAGLWSLRFSEDGDILQCAGAEPASAGRAHGIPTIHFVDWKTGEIARTWNIGDTNDGYVHDYIEQPDGTLLVATSGQPGRGRFLIQRRGEDKPAFDSTKYLNCHSLSLHPDGRHVVLAGINRNNQGNGTVVDKAGTYVGNFSPLHTFDLAPPS